jgi:hypothetical protein
MRVVVLPELDGAGVVAALVAEDLSPVPEAAVDEAPGFYAWWSRPERLVDSTPRIPAVHPPRGPGDWVLLYVGIAPKRPSRTGGDRTIAARVSKDHRGGNIGGSTFRQSLAALLREHLGLVAKSGHDRPRLIDEKPLSAWIDKHCALTTAITDKPWSIEDEVIRELRAPLNLRPGYHPFRLLVQEARAALRRDCGL